MCPGARVVLGASYAPTAHHPRPEEQVWVTDGPYRWQRHPMYLGNLVSVVGLLVLVGARWSWAALPWFVGAQVWRVRREEAALRERFPECGV